MYKIIKENIGQIFSVFKKLLLSFKGDNGIVFIFVVVVLFLRVFVEKY